MLIRTELYNHRILNIQGHEDVNFEVTFVINVSFRCLLCFKKIESLIRFF